MMKKVPMTSRLNRLSTLQRYLAALACVAFAMFARWLLGPLLGPRIPFLLQLIAVLVAARWFGFGPAVLGLFLATSPVFYAAAMRTSKFTMASPQFWVGIIVIHAIFVFFIWLLDRQRRMRFEFANTTQLASERLQQLNIEVA